MLTTIKEIVITPLFLSTTVNSLTFNSYLSMKDITTVKLIKSFKDNALSLIYFCGDLDCLQPVKYLDNPYPGDVREAFLFNTSSCGDCKGEYDEKEAQIRRRNGVALATSCFMPTYGIHISMGKTLASSLYTHLFSFLNVDNHKNVDNHMWQVETACAYVLDRFLYKLNSNEILGCRDAVESMLRDVKRTQNYLINRWIALKISRLFMLVLRHKVKDLAGNFFTPYLVEHFFHSELATFDALRDRYPLHNIKTFVDVNELALIIYVCKTGDPLFAEVVERISFPADVFYTCRGTFSFRTDDIGREVLAQNLKEQECHIKNELDKVEVALTSAKSERYLQGLLKEWLDAHEHYQGVNQRLEVLLTDRSKYLITNGTCSLYPAIDTSLINPPPFI